MSNNKFELWKSHCEASNKFSYFIVTLSLGTLTYTANSSKIGCGAPFQAEAEALSLIFLAISICCGLASLEKNISIINENYQHFGSTSHHIKIHKLQNLSILLNIIRNVSFVLGICFLGWIRVGCILN